jgi:hypothetical protein
MHATPSIRARLSVFSGLNVRNIPNLCPAPTPPPSRAVSFLRLIFVRVHSISYLES